MIDITSPAPSALPVVAVIKEGDTQDIAGLTSAMTVPGAMRDYVENSNSGDNAFFVCDLAHLASQHALWRKLLPRVEPFYAVKCNPNRAVLSTLERLGLGFDCASQQEIETVLDMGVDPSRIIFANPCKQGTHLQFAADRNVRLMTFDNADELDKVRRLYPHADLVLRIRIDDSKSLCRLGLKFGADPIEAPALLALARFLNLNVVGVSFHVGSGCYDAYAFTAAVRVAHGVFQMGESFGFSFTLLDIGGGFPGSPAAPISFEDVCATLAPTIDELFPRHVRVIAEPGRFYVCAAFTLAVNIIARRTIPAPVRSKGTGGEGRLTSEKAFMYYVNDGVYGSFNNLIYDHAAVAPRVLTRSGVFQPEGESAECVPSSPCSVWGPTCDSIDCVNTEVQLPELDVGDWLYYDDMGAYTMCAASEFNGFKKTRVIFANMVN
ncbi:ornithine decarboxylase [Plasmodiophora brassicae]|uniref:ornithine decarboxylase n=1 Tax=Plasmodiophora brassicae TaxID=37360 RepID=A0A0G4IWK1_PLABS|nr:hypothetical protein PBRA_001377 [Plasmodiophora brassicae]SPQ97479.1 unnamed protein product [Plasmodiophora brassicae]